MSMSTLRPSTLALELWMEVGHCCGIKDLISLASTCRRMNLALDSKVGWKSKLEDVCDDYGIIAGTYSVQEMTLQEMKNALRRPHIWTKLVHSHGIQGYPTFDGTIPRCSAVVELPSAQYERMTPGGRYFFRVQDERQTFTLQIFDLGLPAKADTLVQPRLIADELILGTGGSPLRITSCTTSNAVLVSVTWHDKDSAVNRSFVYRIAPSIHTAWTTLSRMTFRSTLHDEDPQMTPDFLHFNVGDGQVLSWQFHDNKFLKWTMAGVDRLLQVIVHPRGVIFSLQDRMLFISHSSLTPFFNSRESDTHITLTADDTLQVMFKCARCSLLSEPCLNPSRQRPLVVDLTETVIGFPFSILEVEQADGTVKLELKPVTLYGEISLGFRFPPQPGIRAMLTHTTSTPGTSLGAVFTQVQPTLYQGQLGYEGLKIAEFCQISARAHLKYIEPNTLVQRHAWVDFIP